MRNHANDSDHSPLEPLISARLHEVILTSPDVEQLGSFYEDALGYAGDADNGIWRGQRDGTGLMIREGKPNSIDAAVFSVEDEGQLSALRDRLAVAGIPWADVALPDMLSSVQFSDPDGNRMVFGVPAPSIGIAERGPLSARLQHVVYASDQVAPMLDFYRNVVGFAPADTVFDESEDMTAVFLRCSDEHHSLAIFRAPRRRIDHICYEVADWSAIRDWADRMADRRIPLRWGPGRHGPGNNLFFFVNDPDGNWLEFSAELERVDVARPAGRWPHEERTLNSWGPGILRS